MAGKGQVMCTAILDPKDRVAEWTIIRVTTRHRHLEAAVFDSVLSAEAVFGWEAIECSKSNQIIFMISNLPSNRLNLSTNSIQFVSLIKNQ